MCRGASKCHECLLVQNMTSVVTLVSVSIPVFMSILFIKLTKVLHRGLHSQAYKDVLVKFLHIFNILSSFLLTSQLKMKLCLCLH